MGNGVGQSVGVMERDRGELVEQLGGEGRVGGGGIVGFGIKRVGIRVGGAGCLRTGLQPGERGGVRGGAWAWREGLRQLRFVGFSFHEPYWNIEWGCRKVFSDGCGFG